LHAARAARLDGGTGRVKGMALGERAYLDHNATSPVRPAARAAMVEAVVAGGNPSSVHAEGRAARARIETARAAVAALAGIGASDVVFTSGGTEAAATALRPGLGGAGVLVTSAIEHPCVLHGSGFPPQSIRMVPVTPGGVVDLAALERALAGLDGATALVSIQLANNETGVVQPLAEIARLTHRAGGILHSDAVQAFGKIPVDLATLGIDIATVSAHKLGGPQGVGAILFGPGAPRPAALIRGGGQERGARAGTENGPGIAGFGAAAAEARIGLVAEAVRLGALRDRWEAGLRELAPDLVIFGAGAERLPNTSLAGVPGLSAETALIAFDLDGVGVSSGSACSSGKVRRSHVLEAMGVGEEPGRGALRISFGWSSDNDDVIRALRSFEKVKHALDKRTGSRAA
jgi:cysteine desulfurase